MKNENSSVINKTQTELQLTVHLTVYEKLRDAILHNQIRQEQNLLLSLGSLSVLLPLLLNQIEKMPTPILAALFYLLAIIYSLLSMNYDYWMYEIMATSNYLHNQLEPQFTNLTGASCKICSWESYIRNERSKPIHFILSAFGPSAMFLLILFPGVISIIVGYYLQMLPEASIPAANSFVGSITSNLSVLFIISLIVCIVAILLMGLLVYNNLKGYRWATDKILESDTKRQSVVAAKNNI